MIDVPTRLCYGARADGIEGYALPFACAATGHGVITRAYVLFER